MNLMNRMPPKRLAVIVRLQALLEQIAVIDGDCLDMAGKVYRNRLLFGADVTERAPALSIVEAPRSDFASFAGEENFQRLDKLTLLVQGIVEDDKTVNTEDYAYYLCQDVERRLKRISQVKESGSPKYPDAYLLGGMISSVEVAPPVIRPPEAQVSSHAFFYIPIRLGIGVEIGE